MRISFQRSGGGEGMVRGRGEYELAEQSNGIDAARAVGHDLILRIGPVDLTTGIWVTHQQGKYRLRRRQPGSGMQIGRQVAAVLLMPKPVREQAAVPQGSPRLVTSSYILDDIELGDAELNATELRARAVDIDFKGTGRLDVSKRWAELETIAANRDALPTDLSSLLAQHDAVTKRGVIGAGVESLTADIQRSLARSSAALGIGYEESEDPVPSLLEALGGPVVPVAEPKPAEPLATEPVEVRRREVKRARAWMRRRPAAAAKFSREVRAAYDHRCVICGERFQPTPRTKSGVDADHIMPWAGFDDDTVRNGLCLCKSHHWMVDEGLLAIEYAAPTGEYQVVAAAWVQELAPLGFSVTAIQACAGPIPANRLPVNAANRPHPELLERAAKLIA
jgi:hypothetical protein